MNQGTRGTPVDAETMPTSTLGFVGAGTVGTALAVTLSRRGYQVVAVASRSFASARCLAEQVEGCIAYPDLQAVADAGELVFITTPDDAIASVAEAIRWRPGRMVVHCSGSLSAEVLDSARDQGALTGGLHPLQTFAGAQQAVGLLPGSTFALEAEDPVLAKVLEGMVQALGGRAVKLRRQDKALYHAAAVMACNYLVTLFSLATDLWMEFGASKDEAGQALMPLVRGTLANLERIGLPDSLTGPIARGDVGTVKKHLEALATAAPGILPAYRALGLQTIAIGLAKGTLPEPAAERLRYLLSDVEEDTCG